MRRRLIPEFKVKARNVIQNSILTWLNENSIEFAENELYSLTYAVFKANEELYSDSSATKPVRDPEIPLKSRGAALHRWVRYKLNDYYIIANLPKKQAIMTRPNQISVHILDESTYLKNIRLVKSLIINPHPNWIWYSMGEPEYIEWRRLMSRWNSYAAKTSNIQELKTKPIGLTN